MVINAQRDLIDQAESEPDAWFRNDNRCEQKYRTKKDADTICYAKRLIPVRKQLAAYINAAEESTVFMENASGALNAVIRSLEMGPGDRVLILSTAYSVVPNILTYLNSWTKGAVQFVTVPIEFPVSGAADFVAPVQAALDAAAKEGHPFRLAVFSHISSVPAVVLPVEELATICAAAGVRTFIDGAHAVGQITVDMTALEKAGVTYYTGNGHKWIYSPKGSAFLWSTRQKDAQAKLAPPVISSEAGGGGGFEASFLYTGTRDYTAFVAMGDALKWREDHGGDAVINGYVTGLSHWAEVYLCKRWGTQPIAPPHMTSCPTGWCGCGCIA